MEKQATQWKANAQTLLDVRPELAQGGDPLVHILESSVVIKPGGTLVIVAPFEPAPLYDVLGERGFTHRTEQVTAGEWVVQFTRTGSAEGR